MKSPSSTTKFLGSFDAGTRFVDLYARKGENAEFHMQPAPGKNARITVGIDDKWWIVFSTLVHEILELTFAEAGSRFAPAPDVSRDNGNYHFSMSHTQFSESSARATLFLAEAIPALQQYWKKKKKK